MTEPEQVTERRDEVAGPPSPPPEEGRSAVDEGPASLDQPAKVMRIASMAQELLEEARRVGPDEAGRARLRRLYEQSMRELATACSPDLARELDRLMHRFDGPAPSDDELRVAQAQLVGWLEGLFHGISTVIVAHRVEDERELEQLLRRRLAAGERISSESEVRPDAYL